jgi:predicted metal-dependent hydrolase
LLAVDAVHIDERAIFDCIKTKYKFLFTHTYRVAMPFIVSADFSYTVKLQRRKTLGLYVLADGEIEVRAPLRTAQRTIVAFVEQRADWVLKTRAKQLQRQQWQIPVETSSSSWYLGSALQLQVVAGADTRIVCDEQYLRVTIRDPDNLALLTRYLEAWYRTQALTIFSERLLLVCQRFPGILAAPELRLRKMRRRWGSCSRSGRVTLNVDLVKLPLTLIDYVIAHELCHLSEFNHGQKFYRLLQHVMPDWKQREVLLKQF